MKLTILLLILFLSIAATGQVKIDLKQDLSGKPVLYVYDGLVIKSGAFGKALDSPDILCVDLITEDVKMYYNIPDSVSIIRVTTKKKVNKRLKAFTELVTEITRQFPFVEFTYKGKMLDSDSLRIVTLNQLKPKKYRINFYPPARAIKKFGPVGQHAVIEIVTK